MLVTNSRTCGSGASRTTPTSDIDRSEPVKTTCLLYKSHEFSSKWSSEADLELHFSRLDLNIRLVMCMAACLWRPRCVTEQYWEFLNTRRALNDIWNDIWMTSKLVPGDHRPIWPLLLSFSYLHPEEKKRQGKNTCRLYCWHFESTSLVDFFSELKWRYWTRLRTILSRNSLHIALLYEHIGSFDIIDVSILCIRHQTTIIHRHWFWVSQKHPRFHLDI